MVRSTNPTTENPDGLAYQFCSRCGKELVVEVTPTGVGRVPQQVSVYLVCPTRRGILSWLTANPNRHDEIYIGTRPAETPYDPYTGERNKK